MTVVVLAESFLPHMNGVTHSLLQVLRHLERRGDEALVVAPRSGPVDHGLHGARGMHPDASFTGYLGGDALAEAMASFDVFEHPGESERRALGRTASDGRSAKHLDVVPVAPPPRDRARGAAPQG